MRYCYNSYYSLIKPVMDRLDATDNRDLLARWHKISHDVICDDQDAKKAIKLLTEDQISSELLTALKDFDIQMDWGLERIFNFKFHKANRDVGKEIVSKQLEVSKKGTVLFSSNSNYIILILDKGGNGEINVWEKEA